MIKRNKIHAILSSVVILLPVLAVLLCWDQLDPTIITHWGLDGTPDGTGSRYWLFLPPVLMLALHWVALAISDWDSRRHPYGAKAEKLVFWIMPAMSWFMTCGWLMAAQGRDMSDLSLPLAGLGLLFVVLGNYMPKVQQNSTLGIKIKWTLENRDNWYATHRVAGKAWVIGGLLMIFAVLLPEKIAMAVMLLVMIPLAVLPAVYSWNYARKQKAAGTYTVDHVLYQDPMWRTGRKIAVVTVAAVLVLLFAVTFTGDITFDLTDTALRIEASYWNDLTVEYAVIDKLEYRDENPEGTRTNGYGSPRLLMGKFQNDEFGRHTRYSYTKCPNSIILTCGEQVLVLSGPDAAATRQLYQQLVARTGK